jgi:ribosome biogenesis GTPase
MIDSPIDFDRLHAIGLTAALAQRFADLPPLGGEPCPMRITEVQRDGLTLHDGARELAARALRLAGVSAVVVLTKADTCAEVAPQLEAVRELLPRDVSAVAVNARSKDSRVALADWLHAGRTLVLLGSSGAGKSTLTNTLIGHEAQLTGEARRGDGRGRHTTSVRCLHRTPEGACIIDTPGLRTLRLDGDEGALAASFADIAELMTQCRFRDCRHEQEPGCAVRERIEPQRLRNYQKLLREAQRDTLSALQRKQQVATWKSRARHARMRMQDKRG